MAQTLAGGSTRRAPALPEWARRNQEAAVALSSIRRRLQRQKTRRGYALPSGSRPSRRGGLSLQLWSAVGRRPLLVELHQETPADTGSPRACRPQVGRAPANPPEPSNY